MAIQFWGGRRSNRDEVFKSYLLPTWSEWGSLQDEGFDEICAMTRSVLVESGMAAIGQISPSDWTTFLGDWDTSSGTV